MKNTTQDDLEVEVGIEVIGAYKRLSYTAWYAFAEFVDNSTQAFFNNEVLMRKVLDRDGTPLIVDLQYDRYNGIVTVSDNSIGMSKEDLKSAMKIGVPPQNHSQRSKYGLGLKTAACWFGNYWTLRTKKEGLDYAIEITFDVDKISTSKNYNLPTEYFDEEKNLHYTKIKITKLNQQFQTKTITKIREYLMSMYRYDFKNIPLVLKWNNSELSWIDLERNLYITQDGKPYKKQLDFMIGTPPKRISGWVGVLGKGSRKDAGFSLVQNNRVIKGWPSAYKPATIFGDQDLGVNDLINQRVLGELFVDPSFAVSHTKDNILWQDSEEEELEVKLGDLCADAKLLASTLRVRDINVDDKIDAIKKQALTIFQSELKSDEMRDRIFNQDIPTERDLQFMYQKVITSTKNGDMPAIEVAIGSDNEKIVVKIYFRASSEFEPYVIIETSTESNLIFVILNVLHPYWNELKNIDGFLSYIRHCVYDGLSEWRASKKHGRISHDTVKFIKDQLLRLPFDISNNSVEAFRRAMD